MDGKLIKTLLAGDIHDAGRHDVIWDSRDSMGRMVGAGMYLYRMEAGDIKEIRQMILLK